MTECALIRAQQCYNEEQVTFRKWSAMYDLPLFPLNTVLFPGMPLKLHIFEERYKQMITYCYRNGLPFGVVLIKSGAEVGGRAEPYLVGCTAVITELEPLPGGRFNIVAVGYERFKIHGFKHDRPYLVGSVENYPIEDPEPPVSSWNGQLIEVWLLRYMQILAAASDTTLENQELPKDPIRLAYLAAYILNIPVREKQDLLSIPNADKLTYDLHLLYRREVTLLEAMMEGPQGEDIGNFSAN